MNTQNPIELLAAKSKQLASAAAKIEKLQASRTREASRLEESQNRVASIDSEMNQILAEAGMSLEVPVAMKTVVNRNKRVLPRGVLTLATLDALKSFGKKGASISEVVEIVKTDERAKPLGERLVTSVRNLMSNSDYFSHVEGKRGTFVLSGKKPGGTLFTRLAEEALA